jgi:hypothetical protein
VWWHDVEGDEAMSSHTRLHADDFITHPGTAVAVLVVRLPLVPVARGLIWCHCCQKAHKWTSPYAQPWSTSLSYATVKPNGIGLAKKTLDPGSEGPDLLM